ncbi:sugar-binding transcriptional regulator [Gemmobacter denitrificans]|uniref:Sugar-binding domain-containing protein n=1 Tax=Gemmobacter denitrificans TaxID=3123040 RepID=A0ABU8BUW6_9RHOB
MKDRSPYSARLPADASRDHLMLQVAKSYFELDRTQAEIAADLGLTRWQVARLLSEARSEGVVRIEITPRTRRDPRAEVALAARFGLEEAIVVPMGAAVDDATLAEGVAQAAAQWLAALTPKPALIGVSWGRSMAALARALPQGWAPGLEVVLVNGAAALQVTDPRISSVAEDIAARAGGQASLLPVPAILGQPATRAALESDPVIARVLARAAAAPLLAFGLGAIGHGSVLHTSGYLSRAELDTLQAHGAVGDLLGRFLTADGRIADPALDARTLGLPLAALQGKRTLCLVSGAAKHAITAAALRAGLISVLVTDAATADFLLERPNV